MTESHLTERDQIRLMEYLDGRLPADAAADVERWLADDPAARRLADQHRRTWDLLGEASETLPSPAEAGGSDAFRHTTLERVRRDARPRPAAARRSLALLAAALLVVVTLFALQEDPAPWSRLSAEERDIVQNLDLLESLDLLDTYGRQLDLAVDIEIMRAFDGELAEGAR